MNAQKFTIEDETIAQRIFRAMQEYGIPFNIPRRTMIIPEKNHILVFDEHPIYGDHNISLYLFLSKFTRKHPILRGCNLGDFCEALAPEIDRLREERWKTICELNIFVQPLGPSPITPEYEERAKLFEDIFKEGQRKKFKHIQTISAEAVEHEERKY